MLTASRQRRPMRRFSPELVKAIEERCARLRPGAVVISLTTKLDGIDLVGQFDVPASWGVATAFVHRRAGFAVATPE